MTTRKLKAFRRVEANLTFNISFPNNSRPPHCRFQHTTTVNYVFSKIDLSTTAERPSVCLISLESGSPAYRRRMSQWDQNFGTRTSGERCPTCCERAVSCSAGTGKWVFNAELTQSHNESRLASGCSRDWRAFASSCERPPSKRALFTRTLQGREMHSDCDWLSSARVTTYTA